MSEREVDLALVRRVQSGDKKAFDLLVLKYQHKIASLVSRLVHDHAEVQDVTQEAFIKAYRGLKNFRGDSAFYTWLYRISINTAKNHLASMSRKVTDGTDIADAEHFESAAALHDIADPQRELMTDEVSSTVQQTILSLPDELKAAITLRELKGMSYEEIAEVMECPIGTVRSRIFRAREAIEQKLHPLIDETGKPLN
jgi:RNA polymerase sigma-70 factor (ECF subfamily)